MRALVAASLGATAARKPGVGALGGASTGAALELPALAVPLGAAALVTARRTRDDAVALAVGAGLGLATGRVWPTAPRTVEELRRHGTKRRVAATADGDGVAVVINPAAGTAETAETAETVRQRLPRATVVEVADGDDLVAELRAAGERATVALGAAGGDGTLSAAAAIAYECGIPLLALPAGTLNHFARDLGLLSFDDAFEALAAGEVVDVDLAHAGDRTFVNTASFGAYTALVEARERLQSRIGKWPAVAVALVGVLRRAEPVEITVEGRRRRLWLGFIGNCRYRPPGFAPSWREALDDGELDVRLVDAEPPLARVRLLLAVMTGRLGRTTVYEQRRASTVRLESADGPITIASDGEVVEFGTSVIVGKRADRLPVFAPHR